MTDTYDNLRWLIGAIADGISRRGGEGTAHTLERLAQQDTGAAQFRRPEPQRQPVCAYLAQGVAASMMVDANLAAAIAAVEDRLQWRQTAGYNDAIMGVGFTAKYGWCEFIGSNGFFPGDDFRLGLLLLGPNLHYRDHYHPAPELYWPLTGPSEWKRGAGGFAAKAAGEIIWHKPFVMHATRTLETPLLALWCWTEDTATPPKLAGQ